MSKETIKQQVIEAIDAARPRILALGDELLHTPETAFKETRSSAIMRRELTSLGLPCRDGLALTGLRADLRSGRGGPTVALLAELDAIRVPGHPDADPVTGAAHACGHHAQGTAMIGAAIGLTAAGVLDKLAGNIVEIKFDMPVIVHTLAHNVAFTRGPVLLARDSRFGDGDFTEPFRRGLKDGQRMTGFADVRTPSGDIWMAFSATLPIGSHHENPEGALPSTVFFCDYASAGNTWQRENYYRTWFPEEYAPTE
jgi:hypothetical protein